MSKELNGLFCQRSFQWSTMDLKKKEADPRCSTFLTLSLSLARSLFSLSRGSWDESWLRTADQTGVLDIAGVGRLEGVDVGTAFSNIRASVDPGTIQR